MSNTLVTSSVNPSPMPTVFNVNTSLAKNQTSAEAVNIGNLQEESSILSISDQGKSAGSPVSSTFVSQGGDISSLQESFGNIIDQAETRFQLFNSSGTIIADSEGTAAQQAAYGQWTNGTLALNADTYTAVATPNVASPNLALSLSTTQQQGTSLGVTSQLTGGDTSEYYNFSLSTGNNIKLAFDAGASQSSTRVQLYNSSGNLVADSDGNAFQQANYIALTSGTGLTASTGNYSVEVTYAPGADTTQPINYNFQLYSGKNYAVVYNTNATAQPYDGSAEGSVTATSTAQLYTRQGFNAIGETAAGAINIGWLQQDQSSLDVLSQLTSADSADYFSFTLQAGDNLKFGFDTTETQTPSNLRVQLYDSSGTNLLADSQGTAAQQAAYQALTTTNGLAAKPANYIVKISYANGAPTTDNQYQFNIFSGTSYAAQYKTIASPQTYGNALLSGNVQGSSSSTGMAAYLASQDSSSGDILSTLSALV